MGGKDISRPQEKQYGTIDEIRTFLASLEKKTNKKGEFVLNAEIIETIEETPDTVVTLTNGKKLIVDEPMDEIVRRVMKYRRALHQF